MAGVSLYSLSFEGKQEKECHVGCGSIISHRVVTVDNFGSRFYLSHFEIISFLISHIAIITWFALLAVAQHTEEGFIDVG